MEFRTLARRISGGGAAGAQPAAAPAAAATSPATAAIDVSAYVCVRDLATLDA